MTAIIATLRDNGMRTSSKKHITQHQTSYTEIAQQLHSTEKEETGSTAGISNLLYRSSRVVSGRELKRKQQERLKDDDAYPNTSTSSPFTDIFLQSSHNVQDSDIIESDKFEDAFFSTTTLLQSTLSETGDTSPTKKMISVKPENGANPGMTWTRSRLRALGRDIDNISNASGSSTGKAIKISKDMLSRAVFVAQLDAKFIIVIMDGIICVVDQHAADERVGLERLESALGTSLSSNEGECEQEFFDLSKLKNINVHNLLKGVATEDLKPMILSPIQSTTIAANDELLKKWKFDFDHNPDTRELKLTATPCIGGDKVATQKDFIQFVQALSNGGSSTFMKPAFAKRVLASYACRYAIMFGDVLDDNDCKSLLSSLSKCALSFTCAHGRPSVIPLLDLNGTADGDTDQHSTGHNLCDVGSVADNVPLRFQKRKRNCSGYAQTTHNSI
jgi:DNA mismatch repair ATPase MutL